MVIGPLNDSQRWLELLYRGTYVPRCPGAAPKIAVVGAGLAGLTAAHLLRLGGCDPIVYEASTRVGGRCWSEPIAGQDGAIWEVGGEFIDSDHDDMLALARALDAEVIDIRPPQDEHLQTVYRFGSQHYSESQVQAAFAEIAPRVQADLRDLRERPNWRAPSAASRRLDALSLADYLRGLHLDPWLQGLLEVTYLTLYGRDADDQSALNMLTICDASDAQGFLPFGRSDERYKIRAGSATLTDRLARLQPRLVRERRLVRLARAASSWQLTFDMPGDQSETLSADIVVMAIPFTLARQIDMSGILPPVQQRAIDELGYGTNSKLMLLTDRPCWRDAMLDGSAYTDGALQSVWDSTRQRGAEAGVLTVYLGGRAGETAGSNSIDAFSQGLARYADDIFPGVLPCWTGRSRLANWSAEPFALGSYTSYRPGQWTAFAGVEGAAVYGGLYFAGEHCARASQGYMNGAVETGRLAASAILQALR